MKKTIIISALALCVSVFSVNAKTTSNDFQPEETITTTIKFKVNSFCVSIAKGDIETVKKLISLGEDVNQSSNGMTPLMYAAKYNRADIAKLLIKNGAKIKTRSRKGHTAIKYAKQFNAEDVLVVLKGAIEKKS